MLQSRKKTDAVCVGMGMEPIRESQVQLLESYKRKEDFLALLFTTGMLCPILACVLLDLAHSLTRAHCPARTAG